MEKAPEAALLEQVGQTYQSGWLAVDQSRISQFADVTEDWNFLHVDAEAAAKTPFGGTIAHGFLVLSLLPLLRKDTRRVRIAGLKVGLNYGLDRLRFVSPVPSGSRIRGEFTVISITEKATGQWLETMDVSVSVEGGERPAIAARWLTLYMF